MSPYRVSRAGDRPQGKRSDWDRETTQHRAKTEARICFSQADYVEKVIAAAKALEADRLLLEEFKSKLRFEAENAGLRHQLNVLKSSMGRQHGRCRSDGRARPSACRNRWVQCTYFAT